MSQQTNKQIRQDFFTAWGNRQTQRKSFQVFFHTQTHDYKVDVPVRGKRDTAEKIFNRFLDTVGQSFSEKEMQNLHVSLILGTL